MLPSNLELLKHILDEIQFVLKSTNGKAIEDVTNDPILSRAIIRSLEIIGEATTKIDSKFKSDHPHIEWRKLSNTRNKLIHDYFGIDYEIVWDIICAKLPDLYSSISDILKQSESGR